jgi:hypothetical protein
MSIWEELGELLQREVQVAPEVITPILLVQWVWFLEVVEGEEAPPSSLA